MIQPLKFAGLVVAALAAALFAAPVSAVTCTSVAAGGNWNAPGTWTGCAGGNGPVANTPGSADTAIIATAGASAVTVNVAVTAGAVTVNAGARLTQTASLTLSTATLTGTLNVAGILTSNNVLTVDGPTNITAGTFSPVTNNARTFVGMVTVSGGTWAGTTRAATFRGGLTVNGGTFTAGTAVQTFNTNNQTIGGTVAISIPRITVTGVTLSNSGNLTVTTALAGTGGLTNSTATSQLHINFTGAVGITTLTASVAGNLVDFAFAGAQTIKVPATTYHHLTLRTSGVKTAAAGLSVNGDFTLGGTASFTAGSFTHNFAGNWIVDTTAATPLSVATTSRINFNTPTPAAPTSMGGTTAATIAFADVFINNTSGVTFNDNTRFSNGTTPTLTVSAGATLTPAAAVTITGTGTLTGNGTVQVTRTAAAADFATQYNFTTRTLTNLTVEYIGAAAQTLSVLTYGGLKINNASGVTLSAGDATVNGTLNFTQGIVATGANTVIVSSTGSVSRTGGHVNGNLQKNVATGATARSFEIGDATTYAPVSVSFTNVTAAGNLKARTASGEHPDVASSAIDAGSDVNRYWVLTNGGLTFSGTYDATFSYASGTPVDLDSGTVSGLFSVGKADGCDASLLTCTWTYPTVSGVGASSATATLMTSLGAGNGTSFAIGNRKLNNFLVEAAGGGAIGSQVSGVAFNIRITARDALGTTLASFTGTADISSTCTLSGGSGATGPFTGGVLASWSVTVSSTGNCTLTATRTSGTESGTSNTFSVAAAVASFNVIEPAADPVTGKIYTKIAGQDFALDIVALNASSALATGFTGVVAVEVVDNTSGGACAGLPLVAAFTDQTFVAGDSGRHTLTSPNTVANVYRNAKVRIKSPAAAPTLTSCSGDNFSIRPASLSFAVTDTDRSSAGTGRVLNNNSTASATVHNAGRPFTVTATAYNGAGTPAITTNYDGSPTAVVTSCGGNGDACTATTGTLTLGAWSAAAGTVTTTTGSYDDAGAFTLQLQDTTYATVDAGDGGGTQTISSAAADAGRFVPDHFAVSVNVPAFSTACGAGAFTYVGQTFSYTTAPVITVTAQDASNATTTRYAGTLWRITNASLTGKTYAAAAGTLDSTGQPGTDPVIAGGAGSGTLTFGSGSGLLFSRSAPAAPFDADIGLSINVIDADGVTYASNPVSFGAATAGNGIAFSAGKSMRFGRLLLQNAHGTQQLDLTIPVEAQYWSGTVWQRNVADNCTALPPASLAKGNATGGLNAGALAAGAWSNGAGTLTLAKPGDGSQGSVDITVNLGGTASANACPAWTPAATASNLSWLRGQWCGGAYDRDPLSTATFGIYRSKFIYRRESY